MARIAHESSELNWYLFEESVSMLEQSGYPEHRYSLISAMKRQVALFSKFRFVAKVFWALAKFRRKLVSPTDAPALLLDHETIRYPSILHEASKTTSIYCTGFRSAYYIKKNVFYLPIFGILEALYSGILGDDDDRMNQGIEKLRRVFKEVNPGVIVLGKDNMPVGRAIVLVARQLGIPTVEIQHGIYQSNSPLNTGRYVDYVFVWGEYFKQLYLKQNLRAEATIKVLGYPYELQSLPQGHKKQRLNVYYLGQNVEMYNSQLLESKLETIEALDKMCKKLGFAFTYRPHPGDSRASLREKLPDVKFSPKSETLEKSSMQGDIFISFSSTSLVEIALRGKLCIQLRNYRLSTDNFEDLGICPRSFDSIDEVAGYLKDIGETGDLNQFYRPVSSKYIEIPQPNSGTAFVKLIKGIT